MPGPLTLQEHSGLLEVPLSDVWRLGREGDLRSAVVRIGGRMRFSADRVEQYIAAGGGASLQPAGAA